MAMTLSRKLIVLTTTLVIGLVCVAGAGLWGLYGQSYNLVQIQEEYGKLRAVYEVAQHVALARDLLGSWSIDDGRVLGNLADAERLLNEYRKQYGQDEPVVDRTLVILRRTIRQMEAMPDPQLQQRHRADRGRELNMVLNGLGQLAAMTGKRVRDAGVHADQQRQQTIVALFLFAAGVVLLAMGVGVSQYRSVMIPLRQLRSGVRDIAAGRFTQRLSTSGDREFAELSDEFNKMAVELDSLYHDLENKVQSKSRELVRSERLASVGFLAAGVAHEINNPLGIISGYAELAERRLKRLEGELDADLCQSLEAIRSEAFRCKGIIAKLLNLTKMGEDARSAVDVSKVADETARLVEGLPKYRKRKLDVSSAPTGEAMVWGNEQELKQVLLNLIVNALEAVADGRGVVRVSVVKVIGEVIVTVSDNGRGMDQSMVGKIFEPFFTSKKGRVEGHGTGLGLSITHAIVQNHQGTMTAYSAGPGLGSRFEVHLPELAEEASHHDE